MIQLLNDLPLNVVGIEMSGSVTKDEYDKVVPGHMNELAKRTTNLNYLLVLRTDLSNFEAAVWWEDLKMALSHFSKWNKVAIVSDQHGVKMVTNLLGFALPGKHEGFKLKELAKAIAWLATPAV